MQRHIDQELANLKTRLLQMGALVEEQIERAITAMIERDAVLAGQVIERDTLVNRFDVEIDETCIRLLALQAPCDNELHRAALAANQLSQAYAEAIHVLLAKAALAAKDITAIGCHGQTIRHQPQSGYTTQLGNGALLAELTGITVVNDFRSRDIAAGGQGAPLLPALHQRLFQAANEHRVIVNIGGIANLTNLPPASARAPVG